MDLMEVVNQVVQLVRQVAHQPVRQPVLQAVYQPVHQTGERRLSGIHICVDVRGYNNVK